MYLRLNEQNNNILAYSNLQTLDCTIFVEDKALPNEDLFNYKYVEVVFSLKDKTDYELIAEAKQYLLDTDWIIVKINETQLLGQDIQPLLTKYSAELAEREAKRNLINSLEG